MKHPPLPAEDLKTLRRLYPTTLAHEIAAMLGTSPSRVTAIAQRMGLKSFSEEYHGHDKTSAR